MPVGLWACYLFEAVLRETPYFTKTARLQCLGARAIDEVEDRTVCLNEAADAYEQWFRKCFNTDTQSVTCPPEVLPEVDWGYDLDAWETYKRVARE